MGSKSKDKSQGRDRLIEANERRWKLLTIKDAVNPNRQDGKFKIRRWGFMASSRFGPRLVSIVQDLFKRVGGIDLEKLGKNMDGSILNIFDQLEALNIDWGDMLAEHVDYIHNIICHALLPNFKDMKETELWVEDNIDFFSRGNVITLILDIVLLQFGLEERSKNVEGLPADEQ